MSDERDKFGMKIADKIFPTLGLVEDEARRDVARRVAGLWNTLVNEKCTMEAWFLVTNNRVDFTYTLSAVLEAPDPEMLAEAIVRAVNEFGVEHEVFKHTEIARSDGRKVRYTKHARIDWAKGVIVTSFVPEEGDLFVSCMGSLVVELRKQIGSKASPKKSEAN